MVIKLINNSTNEVTSEKYTPFNPFFLEVGGEGGREQGAKKLSKICNLIHFKS